MTLRLRTYVALVVLSSMPLACGDGSPTEELDTTERSGPTSYRFIAVLGPPLPPGPLPTCDSLAPSGWSGAPLFTASGVPAIFGRYCKYEGPNASPPTIPGAVRIDRDFDIVVPQATPTQALSQLQSDRALQAWGAMPTGMASGIHKGPYVAIIDTADSTAIGAQAPSYSATTPQQHGIIMRTVIGAIRCPSGGNDCLARMFSVQAFPYDDVGSLESGNPGYRGSLGSLAVAIVEGWDQWKTYGDGSGLINSMSLGWDPSFSWIPSETDASTDEPDTSTDELDASNDGSWGNGEPWDLPQVDSPLDLIANPSSSVPATVQAVYAALTLAACDGVLSLAAAGNDRGLRCEQQGPLAPAAWESHIVPIDECQALELDTSGFEEGPLVYAVGGLDAKDRPIANALSQSMPTRALYAHQVVVPVGGGDYSEPLTGTSLATAAEAGIAAERWAQSPSDSAHDVMTALDASGLPIGNLSADWGPSQGLPVRRIDAHSALDGGPGADVYLPRTQTLLAGLGPSLGAATTTVQATTVPPLGTAQNPTALHGAAPGTHCGSQSIFAPLGASGALPSRQPLDDELRPQPHVPICPNCPTYKTVTQTSYHYYSLSLQLNALVVGNNTISDVRVAFTDPTSGDSVEFSLGLTPTTNVVVPLDQYSISGLSCLPPNNTTPTNVSAWLQCHPDVTAARVAVLLGGPNPQVVTNVVDVLP